MVSTLHLAAARRLRARVRMVRALVAGFAGWTAVVWGGRIRNVLAADDLGSAERAWRLALAGAFVAGGLWVAGALWAARGRIHGGRDAAGTESVDVPGSLRRAVTALAGATVAVWIVRGGTILLGSYDVGFKVVHSVLGLASIAVAVATWSALGPRSTAAGRRR